MVLGGCLLVVVLGGEEVWGGGGGLFLHFSLGLFPRDVFLLLWDHPKTSKKNSFYNSGSCNSNTDAMTGKT